MRFLSFLISVAHLAAPGAAASSRLASSTLVAGLASESTYAANNPVRRTDRNGTYAPDSASWDRLAESQLSMTSAEKGAQGRAAVSFTPAVGDFIAAAISIGELVVSPSMASLETAGWDALGAALPIVPAIGTLKQLGAASDIVTDTSRMLPSQAGPVGHISPTEVINKTPSQIDDAAKRLGLEAKGTNPTRGEDSYVDPQTDTQRILSHPDDPKGAHGHVNDPNGKRIDAKGNRVPSESPEAHLPIKDVP